MEVRCQEGSYEVCTGELLEPELAEQGESPEARAVHETKLKTWDKADRSASQVIVKTVESGNGVNDNLRKSKRHVAKVT
jgi:hypothetical protein